jgi:hypothetical protein
MSHLPSHPLSLPVNHHNQSSLQSRFLTFLQRPLSLRGQRDRQRRWRKEFSLYYPVDFSPSTPGRAEDGLQQSPTIK